MAHTENGITHDTHKAGRTALRCLQFLFRVSLVALLLLALAVIGYFVYEAVYPPRPINAPGVASLFGPDDGRRAPHFLFRSVGYAAHILFIASLLKTSSGFVCMWIKERCGWKFPVGFSLLGAAIILAAAKSLSCGCAPPLPLP